MARARAHDRPCGGGSAARGGERENFSVVDPASLGGTTTMRSSGDVSEHRGGRKRGAQVIGERKVGRANWDC